MSTFSPTQPPGRLSPRVVVKAVAAILLLVAAPLAANYARNHTDLGIRLIGHPDLEWEGGSFPESPKETAATYRVSPLRLELSESELPGRFGLTEPTKIERPAGTTYRDGDAHLAVETYVSVLSLSYTEGGSHKAGIVNEVTARRRVQALVMDLGLSPRQWRFRSEPPHAVAGTRVLITPVVAGRVLAGSEHILGGFVTVHRNGITSAVLNLGRWSPSSTVEVGSAERAWDQIRHDPELDSQLHVSGPYSEVSYDWAALLDDTRGPQLRVLIAPVWKFRGEGNTTFFASAHATSAAIFGHSFDDPRE